MAGSDDDRKPLVAPGITVALDPKMQVMSLRYFDSSGAFTAAAQRCLRLKLPFAPNAIEIREHERPALLAWRRPGECLLFTRDPADLEIVATATGGLIDGRAINLTGGVCVVRIAGPRTASLLARIGSHDSMPVPRSTRATRIADLPAFLVRSSGPEVYLLHDRAYLAHLMQWLRVSIDESAAGDTHAL
jgi:sarcosine oxidase gamma subunit